MPAGMELFPASTEQQWIKKVIDESDYYIVIVAGRYGSIHPTEKISYTEMEYRYAVSIGKPVLAFLHSNLETIISGKAEKSAFGRSKLLEFRKLCQTRLCKMWDSPADLGAKVSRSVTQLIKREPAIGWIRGDQGGSSLRLQLLEAKLEIEKLKANLTERWSETNEILAGGSDSLKISYVIETSQRKIGKGDKPYWIKGDAIPYSLEITWDEVLKIVGPDLLTSCNENDVCHLLNQVARYELMDEGVLTEDVKVESVKMYSECIKKLRVQFSALGFIEVDSGSRGDFTWDLTERGLAKVYSLITEKTATASPK